MGVISPLGNSAAQVIGQARAGRSGVGRLETPFARRLVAPIAATARFKEGQDVDAGKGRMLDRYSRFALHPG